MPLSESTSEIISIRDSSDSDEKAINHVVASAVATLRKTYRPNAKAQKHKQRISTELHRLVAEYNGQIVGTTQYCTDSDTMRIVGLAVDSDFRHRGVARALINRIVELASEHRLPSVVTSTVVQTGNVPIFKALGFKVISEYPDEYSISGDGTTLTEAKLQIDL